jgi:ectoine hydroxylase-related dioxygenase (phytanoyl-CoA dioxygenase family)
VPGSHKLCRYPTEAEIQDPANYQPVEAKAGSILIWHGNTWHGAYPRTVPGLRLSIIHYFGRFFMRPSPKVAQLVSPEEIARRPARLARLLGMQPAEEKIDIKEAQERSSQLPVAMFSEYG